MCAAGTNDHDDNAATECIKCAKGFFGAANALGESDANYCQQCTHGKYNPTAGSTTCIDCLAGKAGGYIHNHCHKA